MRRFRLVRRNAKLAQFLRYEWKSRWVSYGFNRKVYIQRWPIHMIGRWPLDVGQLFDGGFFEPGKMFEWQQKLFVAE